MGRGPVGHSTSDTITPLSRRRYTLPAFRDNSGAGPGQ